MSPDNEQEQLKKLIELIQEALRQDEQLRQKYQVGEKFRFIRERLQTLLVEVQEGSIVKLVQKKKIAVVEAMENESLVYVHLYNAQSGSMKAWQSIVNPKAFFDYSVNRPIYREKAHIEAFIKAKANSMQHGYLTIAVQKDRFLPSRDDIKDSMGNPLVKVKEGALRCERLVSFTHNGQEYVLNEEGSLIKKEG